MMVEYEQLAGEQMMLVNGVVEEFWHEVIDAVDPQAQDGFNAFKYTKYLGDMTANGNGFVLAATEDGNAVGLVAVTMITVPFACGTIGCELIWYVVPSHRASGVGFELIARMERTAKEMGATTLLVGHFVKFHDAKMTRLYERLGYKPHRREFIKELCRRKDGGRC